MTVYSVISLQKIPYIYTVYDRIFGDFPAKNTVHAPCIYRVMANLYHLCCKARVWLVLNRKRGCATCCLYAMGCAATFVVCGVGWVCYLLLVRYGLCSHVCGVWCGLGVQQTCHGQHKFCQPEWKTHMRTCFSCAVIHTHTQ